MTQKKPRSSVPYMLKEEKSGEGYKYLAYIFSSGSTSAHYSNTPLFIAQGVEVDPTKCYFSNSSSSSTNIINGELYNSNGRTTVKSDSKSKAWSSNAGSSIAINNGSLVYLNFDGCRKVTLAYIETKGVTSCSSWYSGCCTYIKNGNLMYAIRNSSNNTKYSKYTKSSTGKWIGVWGVGPYTMIKNSNFKTWDYPLAINSDGELWNVSTSTSSIGTKYDIPEKVIHVSTGYSQIYDDGTTSRYCPSVITEDGKMYIINGPSSTDFVEAGTKYTAKKKSMDKATGTTTQTSKQFPFITEGGIFGRGFNNGTTNASQIVDENGLVLTDTIGSITDICGSSFEASQKGCIQVYATTENNELYAIREGATTWTKMSAEKILDFPGELVSLSGTGSQWYSSNKNMLITKVPKDWQPEVEYKHKVLATYDQTLLLTQGGAFFQCGYNKQNQQGNSSTSNVTSLRDVVGDVKDIAGSARTSWYVTRNGDLYGCGKNNYGQQGANNTTTMGVYIKRASNVKEVLVNHFSEGEITCYVSINNELYMCGRNDLGQQGSGDTTMVKTFTKRAENVKKVVTRTSATWYLTNDGDLYGCGKNNYGQQGSGDTTNVLTFTKRAENVKDFCAWEDTTFYITNNNELYGCGRNASGQLGAGNIENVLTFRKIADNVRNVYGMDITAYITLDGQLYTAGCNHFGAQGTGDFTNVLEFTKVAENVKQYVNSGIRTAWYITENNELYGCGDNTYGAQGSGTVTGETSPQNNAQCITTFTKRADNVKEIYVSQGTTSYVDLDGVYWMCGRAEWGNQATSTTTPVTTFKPWCNLFIKGLND